MPQFAPGQTLLIDADDTLWENNVYFERAIAAFISYLNHHEYTPAEVRKALNAVERETILAHGYGLTSFTRSLVTCFERLSPAPVTEEKAAAHSGLRPLHCRAGDRVAPRRGRNSGRFSHSPPAYPDDQRQPGRAGRQAGSLRPLQLLFRGRNRAEKDPATYREVIHRHELTPHTSWMIGNSPKSDINPALAAGLHAVFLFHKDTWVLEHAEIDAAPEGQQLLELDSFAKLGSIF